MRLRTILFNIITTAQHRADRCFYYALRGDGMDTGLFATIATLVGLLAAISGMALGWTAKSKTVKQEVKEEASSDAVLRADVEYIKRGVDDVRLEQRAQGQRFDVLSERVTRVEESAKQAHHRLDRLDGIRKEGN